MDLQVALSKVRDLPPSERASLEAILASTSHALWSPSPGPQSQAFYSQADELLYGGSAGGGKSALIVGLALTQHRRTLILRRESTQLRGMIDDIARTLRTRDGLNKQDGQWRLPSSASQLTGISDQLIEFGGVPNPGDEERHQGIPHDLLAFDEVTQLPEYIIDYLSTWCRTTDPNQRTRIVLTSNPPTPSTSYNQRSSSGAWVIRRYAPWLDPQYADPYSLGPAAPGALRWFVTLDGVDREWPDPLPFIRHPGTPRQEVIRPRSRTFIPARVSDNPFLHQTDYETQLQKLPEPLRSAMLYGDFSVSLSDRPLQLIPSAHLRAATQRHRDIAAAALANRAGEPAANRTLSAIGVDVARGGTDHTVITLRYGAYVAPQILLPASDIAGPDVAARVLSYRRHSCPVVIDANGVGASVYDHLVTALALPEIYAYVGSRTSLRKDQSNKLGFGNLRSERYWMLREALDPASPIRLALPDDPELVEELLALTWEERAQKIHVIAKKDLIKQLGRSPDKSDSLMLSFNVPHTEDVEDLDLPASVSDRVWSRAPTRAEELYSPQLTGIDRPKPYQTRRALRPTNHRRVRW